MENYQFCELKEIVPYTEDRRVYLKLTYDVIKDGKEYELILHKVELPFHTDQLPIIRTSLVSEKIFNLSLTKAYYSLQRDNVCLVPDKNGIVYTVIDKEADRLAREAVGLK